MEFLHAGYHSTRSKLSMTALEEVLSEKLVIHGLWPCRVPCLNPWNYYSWGTLKDNIQREIANTSRLELHHVLTNIFRRCKVCLEPGSQYLETVL
jgi:hypothetical protein